MFYFKILELIGHIGIIFHHFEFSTDSDHQFLKTPIHVEFRKNPEIEPIYDKKCFIDDYGILIVYRVGGKLPRKHEKSTD